MNAETPWNNEKDNEFNKQDIAKYHQCKADLGSVQNQVTLNKVMNQTIINTKNVVFQITINKKGLLLLEGHYSKTLILIKRNFLHLNENFESLKIL